MVNLFNGSPRGIERLESDDSRVDGTAVYYTISGQQVDHPGTSGVYILRQGQVTRKVYIGR